MLKLDYYRKYDRLRADNPDRVLARQEYAKTERAKGQIISGGKAWILRNPIKRQAHVIVGNALKGGKLERKPCSWCGGAKVHAHHSDYSKPLEVTWLCVDCHAALHVAERAKQRLQ